MRRVHSKCAANLQRVVKRGAALSEKALLSINFKQEAPIVFILGLPRSGTTLVYQYLAHRLKVAYFTNAVGSYPRAPCIATYIQHIRHGEYVSDFKSNYGKVSGPVAPREAGSFWGRFFDLHRYSTYEQLGTDDIVVMRRTIGCIQAIFGGAPFVNKNVKHLLRIPPLAKVFETARFLVVERNLEDVALSVLRGRQESAGGSDRWWSVRPSNYDDLKKLAIPEQIAGQLIALNEQLYRDLADLDSKRLIIIKYENFCANPEGLVEELNGGIAGLGYRGSAEKKFTQYTNRAATSVERQVLRALSQRQLGEAHWHSPPAQLKTDHPRT